MISAIPILVGGQLALGAFDIVYHHELTERLPWRPSQAIELRLHGARNLAYAVLFLALGWTRPMGLAAAVVLALLVAELVITLWDFVEEDRTRRLPASERITHTLLALNYGALLLLVTPILAAWAAAPTSVGFAHYGVWSWLCAAASPAVAVFGGRDLAASSRLGRMRSEDPARLAAALAANQSVLVTGGTGFIGRRLVEALVAGGHEVTVLARSSAKAEELPGRTRIVTRLDQIADTDHLDAIVNLAGEPISNGLWTAPKRRRILRSRLTVTREVGRLIARLHEPPAVLVSGSAVGWYGLTDGEPLGESAGFADCFSHRLCRDWERAAMAAATRGVRLVRLRIGLVLAAEGGVLSRMLTPFEFGLGGPFGSGRQWMSWIHRDDLVRLIVHAIANPDLSGPVNGTAPSPVTNAEFSAALARALRRPLVFSVPSALLRLALGTMAEEVLLGGQRVTPVRAIESGFRFQYPMIENALAAIVPTSAPKRRSARLGAAVETATARAPARR